MFKLLPLFILLNGYLNAEPAILQVSSKTILVNGKPAKIISLAQPDGSWGYTAKAGESFNLIVENHLTESTVIHWHGLELPNSQDGTELTQAEIPPGAKYQYNFPLLKSGSYWMHSHYALQEVSLATAPLIIESANDSNYQQVVVLLQDFSFKSPAQLLNLLENSQPAAMDMAMSDHSSMTMDLNDVAYDAFLANQHDPHNPQIVTVKAGAKVKLRLINAAASSNFWVSSGKLRATAVAIDGNDIQPLRSKKFQLAEAQRMDLIVTIPATGGTFPIIAQVEGLKSQTGIILTTNKNLRQATIPQAAKAAPALNDQQEIKLRSLTNLATRPLNQVIEYNLSGSMQPYLWQINGQTWPKITPQRVEQGQRIELVFNNHSMMAHPMHLHGYSFQVVEVNGKQVAGAIRDSVLVLPHETVKVVFDANQPGKWLLHCHIAWHMPTGMMTYLEVLPQVKNGSATDN